MTKDTIKTEITKQEYKINLFRCPKGELIFHWIDKIVKICCDRLGFYDRAYYYFRSLVFESVIKNKLTNKPDEGYELTKDFTVKTLYDIIAKQRKEAENSENINEHSLQILDLYLDTLKRFSSPEYPEYRLLCNESGMPVTELCLDYFTNNQDFSLMPQQTQRIIIELFEIEEYDDSEDLGL